MYTPDASSLELLESEEYSWYRENKKPETKTAARPQITQPKAEKKAETTKQTRKYIQNARCEQS